jgi:hypothetical protein
VKKPKLNPERPDLTEPDTPIKKPCACDLSEPEALARPLLISLILVAENNQEIKRTEADPRLAHLIFPAAEPKSIKHNFWFE